MSTTDLLRDAFDKLIDQPTPKQAANICLSVMNETQDSYDLAHHSKNYASLVIRSRRHKCRPRICVPSNRNDDMRARLLDKLAKKNK